jgi:hypothetical protein
MSAMLESAEQRKLRRVKTAVLTLAGVVALTITTAAVFAVYSYTTDRPAKEMFR